MARPILTAEQMRTAEAQAIAAGTPETTLMERAGRVLPPAAAMCRSPSLATCCSLTARFSPDLATRRRRAATFRNAVAASFSTSPTGPMQIIALHG